MNDPGIQWNFDYPDIFVHGALNLAMSKLI